MKENVYIQAKEVKDEPTEHVIQTLHNAHPMLTQLRMCTRRVRGNETDTLYRTTRHSTHEETTSTHTHA